MESWAPIDERASWHLPYRQVGRRGTGLMSRDVSCSTQSRLTQDDRRTDFLCGSTADSRVVQMFLTRPERGYAHCRPMNQLWRLYGCSEEYLVCRCVVDRRRTEID